MINKKVVSLSLIALASYYFFAQIERIKFHSLKIVHKISVRLANISEGPVESIYANDFHFQLLKTKPEITNKTAGIVPKLSGGYEVYEQSDAQKILAKYKFELQGRNIERTIAASGGLKRIFYFHNNLIGLFTFNNNNSNCYYASLINLTKSVEFMRGSCLPEIEKLDFNGIGGGHAELNENLLIAIGTPSLDGPEISRLAQDPKSQYGKILSFSKSDINTPFNKQSILHVFSMGHRNPQGILNMSGKIYAVEHGPRGGDEINLIEKNKNYGWPIFSLGSKYSGPAYHANVGRPGFVTPIFSFIPSIGISDLSECPKALSKRYFPAYCMLASSLRANSIYVILINPTTQSVISAERINSGMRLRQFYRESETNNLYITTDGYGLYKLNFDNFQDFFD